MVCCQMATNITWTKVDLRSEVFCDIQYSGMPGQVDALPYIQQLW